MARLVEENRGLRHRLAKYEASPQQARYKYARQAMPLAASNAHPRSAGSKPATSPLTSGGGRNGSSNKGPAAGATAARSKGSGGPAAKSEGCDRHNAGGGGGGGGTNCGKPVSCVNSRESAAFADRVLQF